MKDNEQVRQLAFCLMVVHRYSCKKCRNMFIQAVSTSDTDMVPIFLSSVYSPQSSTLVIMELTENELRFGWSDSMPKRAERLFSGNAFFYIDFTQVCPICGEPLEQKQISRLSDYIKEHPKVYLVYFGKEDEEEIVVPLAQL